MFRVCSSLPVFLIANKHSGLLALRLALLFYYQLYISIYNLLALLPSLDAMQSCLLTPSTGVNIEAIGLYAIIFDALYGSSILSSPLFTLGYSDADWAGDLSDRKLTPGHVFMLRGRDMLCSSRKKKMQSSVCSGG